MKKKLSYKRAFLSLYQEIITTATGNTARGASTFSIHNFESSTFGVEPKSGDLLRVSSILLQHAQWSLSWCVEWKGGSWNKCILRSALTGETANWENIGVAIYDRKRVEENPWWQWNDFQWELRDFWFSFDDGYLRPLWPVFSEDGRVLFGTRLAYNLGDAPPPQVIDNWDELTLRQLKQEIRRIYKETKDASERNKNT